MLYSQVQGDTQDSNTLSVYLFICLNVTLWKIVNKVLYLLIFGEFDWKYW